MEGFDPNDWRWQWAVPNPRPDFIYSAYHYFDCKKCGMKVLYSNPNCHCTSDANESASIAIFAMVRCTVYADRRARIVNALEKRIEQEKYAIH